MARMPNVLARMPGVVTPGELNRGRRAPATAHVYPHLHVPYIAPGPRGGAGDRRTALWGYYYSCHRDSALPCPAARAGDVWPEWVYIGDFAEAIARGAKVRWSLWEAGRFLRGVMPNVETKAVTIVERNKRGRVTYHQTKILYRVGPFRYQTPTRPDFW